MEPESHPLDLMGEQTALNVRGIIQQRLKNSGNTPTCKVFNEYHENS